MDSDLKPFHRLHPRHAPYQAAKRELQAFLNDWATKHALTSAESLSLVSGEITASSLQLVRSEHDYDFNWHEKGPPKEWKER